MSQDFIARMIGMILFAILGARLGAQLAEFLNLDLESRALIFGLTGFLFGLILTPYFTTRPLRAIRRIALEMPLDRLLVTGCGGLLGLIAVLLSAYPLSLLPGDWGWIVPNALLMIVPYLGMTLFSIRWTEITALFSERIPRLGQRSPSAGARKLILDTSVLIDGRIADVLDTGFLGGTLIIPRFVMNELHRVADSSDPLRRNRGRRGLNVLSKIQRNEQVPVRIVDDDYDDIGEVDSKLVALALQMNAAIMTNDYNLGQVADAQGVTILNINQLANAVRSVYIPGEQFAIRIIQEGRDSQQGVGYLDDGTMVVVENGRNYMDRTVQVEVTKLITRETGRMIFAIPVSEKRPVA
ncbi:MAG: PIN domain nuclease [Anaerolineae bacterium]|nr:PIN domain nuclease [Anaerolineae bacterium]MDW8173405.1 PIN domain nuclease [Anaerolineae bacterium]